MSKSKSSKDPVAAVVQTQLLAICIQMGLSRSGNPEPEAIPCLLVGAPGVAKTVTVNAIGKALAGSLGHAFPVETLVAPTASAENIAGIPVPNHTNKTTDMYPLGLGRKLIEAGAGVLFIDEFSSASDAVAAASLTLIQSGLLGDHKLPPSVARIAAMNEPERAVAGRQLMAPESNRFCRIPWKLEADDWIDYMKGGVGVIHDIPILPNDWEVQHYFQAQSLVTSFIKARPNLLLKEPDAHLADCAWPSPRSWRNATRLLAACTALGEKYDSALTTAAIAGCVGDGPGTEFLSYVVNLDLPDPQVVLDTLMSGGDFPLKGFRDDKILAIMEALAGRACLPAPDLKERWSAVCDYIMTNKKHLDVSLSALGYLSRHQPKLSKVHPAMGAYFKMMNEMNMLHSQTK